MADAKLGVGRLSLFKNDHYETDKHPSKTGIGNFSKRAARELYEATKDLADDDDEIKLECACWPKTSQGGKEYVFVSFSIKPEREASAGTNKSNAGGSVEDPPF